VEFLAFFIIFLDHFLPLC